MDNPDGQDISHIQGRVGRGFFEQIRNSIGLKFGMLAAAVLLSGTIAQAKSSEIVLDDYSAILKSRIILTTDPHKHSTSVQQAMLAQIMVEGKTIQTFGNGESDSYVVQMENPEAAEREIDKINADTVTTGVSAISDFVPISEVIVQDKELKPTSVTTSDFPTTNQREIGVYEAIGFGMNGSGQAIALMDTPINSALFGQFRIAGKESYLFDGNGVVMPYDSIKDTYHGSVTSSAITSAAPGADIYSFAVCFNDGCSISGAVQAIQNLSKDHPNIRIVNLSFGGFAPNYLQECVMLQNVTSNLLIMAAVGNNNLPFRTPNTDFPGYYNAFLPAGCGSQKIIPVGAYDWRKYSQLPTGFTNYNLLNPDDPDKILISGTGYSYVLAPRLLPNHRDDGILIEQVAGGTSIASPYIAGFAALVLQNAERVGIDPMINSLDMQLALMKGAYCPLPNPDIHDIGCKPDMRRVLKIDQQYLPFALKLN